jgi:hypothetical protein
MHLLTLAWPHALMLQLAPAIQSFTPKTEPGARALLLQLSRAHTVQQCCRRKHMTRT